MTTPFYIAHRDLPPQFAHAIPQSRMVQLYVTDTVFIPSYSGTWCEGSRDTYTCIRLSDGAAVPVSDSVTHPADPSRKDQRLPLIPDFGVVVDSIFQGKQMDPKLMVHPNAVTHLNLPIQDAILTLSPTQLLVLFATRRYKASYNGRTRYQMAIDDILLGRRFNNHRSWFPVTAPIPSEAQITEARQTLIDKGYLTRAYALTLKGKNAAAPL